MAKKKLRKSKITNTLKATQVVNIIHTRQRQKRPLQNSNSNVIRSYYNTPIFHPLPSHPQPVGTRPDIEETVANLQRSVRQLQDRNFPARMEANFDSPRRHAAGDPPIAFSSDARRHIRGLGGEEN